MAEAIIVVVEGGKRAPNKKNSFSKLSMQSINSRGYKIDWIRWLKVEIGNTNRNWQNNFSFTAAPPSFAHTFSVQWMIFCVHKLMFACWATKKEKEKSSKNLLYFRFDEINHKQSQFNWLTIAKSGQSLFHFHKGHTQVPPHTHYTDEPW